MADKTYDTVFLDVDGTLLWVDMDVEGYVRDLAPYSTERSFNRRAGRRTGLGRISGAHFQEYPPPDQRRDWKVSNGIISAARLKPWG